MTLLTFAILLLRCRLFNLLFDRSFYGFFAPVRYAEESPTQLTAMISASSHLNIFQQTRTGLL
jgi:hypothetical protein